MSKVTQTMLYCQTLIKYAEKYGVTKVENIYKISRNAIYAWNARYNGKLDI